MKIKVSIKVFHFNDVIDILVRDEVQHKASFKENFCSHMIVE